MSTDISDTVKEKRIMALAEHLSEEHGAPIHEKMSGIVLSTKQFRDDTISVSVMIDDANVMIRSIEIAKEHGFGVSHFQCELWESDVSNMSVKFTLTGELTDTALSVFQSADN